MPKRERAVSSPTSTPSPRSAPRGTEGGAEEKPYLPSPSASPTGSKRKRKSAKKVKVENGDGDGDGDVDFKVKTEKAGKTAWTAEEETILLGIMDSVIKTHLWGAIKGDGRLIPRGNYGVQYHARMMMRKGVGKK